MDRKILEEVVDDNAQALKGRVLVVAGTFEKARVWADRNQRPRNSWRYVSHKDDLRGFRGFGLVVLADGLRVNLKSAEILREANFLVMIGDLHRVNP